MKWIDKLPVFPLAMATVFMAILPIQGESHLLEKLKMLAAFTLVKPIDVFDLFMHGTPAMLLLVRLFREHVLAIKAPDIDEADSEK